MTTPVSSPRQHGLLEKLMAAVRPEFRAEVIDIDPGDLVFGGPPCRVPECSRIGRSRGLCIGHHHRWNSQGRPDLEEFATTTEPLMRGYAPLTACRVAGCRYGVQGHGLCQNHRAAWSYAGSPPLEQWLAERPSRDRPREHAECLVGLCNLWAQGSTPFCISHRSRWRVAGFPEPTEFIRLYEEHPPGHERLDVRRLTGQLRLEMQYALQRRHDDQRIKTPPSRVRHVVCFVAGTGVRSLLDWTEETWRERFPRGKATTGSSSVALVIYARRQVEELQQGRGWEVEYPRDVWRLRQLGIASPHAHLRFDRIPQPWLKDLAKRWVRWRLSTGLGAGQANKCVVALTRFAEFLAAPAVGVDSLAQVDRPVLERYLAELQVTVGGQKTHGEFIGLVNHFFQTIRQHRWDDTLPTTAVFFAEDYPKRAKRLPRALAEHVMTQLEQPANIDRWQDPAGRLVTLILMRCGLRVSDALKLPLDCIVRDADNAPYLRYFNHKMKREALVPVDNEVEAAIAAQQQHITARWPDGSPVLFPQKTANPDGTKPLIDSSYRRMLNQWLAEVDVRDEHGRRVRPTPHQWRHTFGTRLINRDVPQEVVRVLLDHDSHMMTAHYARLNEKTIRRHWEQARKVDIRGEQVALDPDGHLAEAAWAKQRLGRVTQALPNGFCGLPLQKTCPHANACLTCPMFVTTPEFLPQHRQQREQLLQIVSAAEARGQLRVVEMNQQVLGNLDQIITALEADETPDDTEAADAG
ncbi:tyrosine-type recombinase/integrase [Streptomyces sp. NPDC001205]